MILKKIRQIQYFKAIFIVDELATWGGGSTPLLNFLKTEGHDQTSYKLIILGTRFGFFKASLAFLLQKNIIIVGFDPLKHLSILIFTSLKKNIILFPQTVTYQIPQFFDSYLRNLFFSFLMANKKIACVSNFQKEYFISNYASSNIETVGAIIFTEPPLVSNNDNNKIKILMIGYYSALKGVNFYSEVADLAKKQGLKYEFYWLGDGPSNELYLSKNVTWLGYSANPKLSLSKIDIMFLSSLEDSIPLVFYEALELEKKCVVYKNTGVADIALTIEGCEVYDEYLPNSAINALDRALNTKFNLQQSKNALEKYTNWESFQAKLTSLIQR
jgi:glycosyltransferase involved in cell wall biosynthesis